MCGSQVINVGAFGRNAKSQIYFDSIMLLCDIGSFEASEELRSLEPFSWGTLTAVSFERNLWRSSGKRWNRSNSLESLCSSSRKRENMYSLLSLLPLLHSAASIGGCCCSQVSGFLSSTGACRGIVVTLEHCHCHCNNHSPTKVWNTVAELRSCGRRKQILFTS